MEDQFLTYLAWTKAQGLSRLVAFEPRTGAADVLPNEAMRAAFEDYLVWTTRNEYRPLLRLLRDQLRLIPRPQG